MFGEFGIVYSLIDAGNQLFKAITQLGMPAAAVTTAAAKTISASAAPATDESGAG